MLAVVSVFLALLCTRSLSTGWRITLDPKRIALILVLVATVQIIPGMILREISNPALLPPGIVADGYTEILAQLLVLRAREKLLLLSLVAHAVYYGPVFILLAILWRQVIAETVRFGAGFVVMVALFAALSVFAESRFTFLFWPFVVTVVAKVMSAARPGKIALVVFAVATAYFSKLWLRINQAEWPLPDLAGVFEWPKSIYFSHLGPFINGADYVKQGAVACLTALLLFLALRKAGTPVDTQRKG